MEKVTIGQCELWHGDCMEYMATLPDKAFDLAIVDPPYGIGMDGGSIGKGNQFAKKCWDKETPKIDYFNELMRVSNIQIIWGGNYFCDKLPISKGWIYWDKMQDGFGKTFSTGELAWTSVDIPMKQIRYQWQGNYCGFEGNTTTKTKTGELNIHPTQKPIKLYEWLLTNYAKPGQRILDTHLGSGSSAIAANNMGFEFVGCELDDDYFKSACSRIEQAGSQGKLFDVPISDKPEQLEMMAK